MKNTKELKALLTSLFCINCTGNNDKDIEKILKYTFNRIFDSNTNLLILACVGKTKEDIMPEIKQLLKDETKLEI